MQKVQVELDAVERIFELARGEEALTYAVIHDSACARDDSSGKVHARIRGQFSTIPDRIAFARKGQPK